jgi:hypothetical protein
MPLPRRSEEEPWKGKSPGEQPATAVCNSRVVARNFRRGQSPETAACRAGSALCREQRQEKRYVGANRRGDASMTRRKVNASKGEIPGALPVRNKTGQGLQGANRQEGGRNPEGGTKRVGTPAKSGPASLERAEGTESP